MMGMMLSMMGMTDMMGRIGMLMMGMIMGMMLFMMRMIVGLIDMLVSMIGMMVAVVSTMLNMMGKMLQDVMLDMVGIHALLLPFLLLSFRLPPEPLALPLPPLLLSSLFSNPGLGFGWGG